MIAATQLVVVAVVFVVAGSAKLLAAAGPSGNLATGVSALAAPRRHRVITTCLGVAEIAVGLALLTSPAAVARWAAVGLMAGALGVAVYLKWFRSDVGCGCFGALSTAPVSRLTVVRAGVLLVAAATAVTAPPELVFGVPVVIELLALVAISPELWDRLRPRGDAAELALPCDVRRVPQEDTLRALHASREWRAHAHLLVSAEPSDAWREGCWRFYAYDGDTIQVVFAVRLEGRPPQVKAAVIAVATASH